MSESELSASTPTPASRRWLKLGPAVLVTAAFIGPGTVTTASVAGADHGMELLWTVLFASAGAIVLQSLAARVGIVRSQGLAEAIRESLSNTAYRAPALVLVIAALGVGNAAYQAGNLTGAVAGLSALSSLPKPYLLVIITILASIVLCLGNLKWFSRALIALVCLLSVSFFYTATTSLPTMDRVIAGIFAPSIKGDQLTTVLGMIGTTIVPYNLFLHASSAAETWNDTPENQAIQQSSLETVLAISVGGLITGSILITASSAFFDQQIPLQSKQDLALQLRPTLGNISTTVFAIGLFAAGFTSAITAPLATAYAVLGCFGGNCNPRDRTFKAIALLVLAIGATTAIFFGKTPTLVIVFAQTANAILLPSVAIFLLYVVHFQLPLDKRPRLPLRMAAWLVVVGVSLLATWKLYRVVSSFL